MSDDDGRRRGRLLDALMILKPWPLLVAAMAAIGGAVALLAHTGRAADLGTGLAVLGAVCLGAWIALLAAYGYHGRDEP